MGCSGEGPSSYLDAVLVIKEMAKRCGLTGQIVVEANMGAIGAIVKYGSEAQKHLAAELVLSGDKLAICITEPGAGSAASEMTTRADRRGSGFVINGKKHWITGGGVSRLHLVFARVFDEEGREEGIGGFIALRSTSKPSRPRFRRSHVSSWHSYCPTTGRSSGRGASPKPRTFLSERP